MQGSPEGSHAIHANDEGELARQAALQDEAKRNTLQGLERAARRLQVNPDSGFWRDALTFWTRCAQEDFDLDTTPTLR